VTHDQDEAMTLSDQIVVMHQGRIQQVGTPQEIYSRPRTLFVADFIGKGTFLAGTVRGVDGHRAEVETAQGSVRVPAEGFRPGEPVWLLLRPETIGLGPPATGRWQGRIAAATYLGSEIFYEVTVGEQNLLVKVGHPQGATVLGTGDPVGVLFDEGSLHLLRREGTA
jgi:ABC-type Fe3+/spermidine/putrescine transport system ATPase subunit